MDPGLQLEAAALHSGSSCLHGRTRAHEFDGNQVLGESEILEVVAAEHEHVVGSSGRGANIYRKAGEVEAEARHLARDK